MPSLQEYQKSLEGLLCPDKKNWRVETPAAVGYQLDMLHPYLLGGNLCPAYLLQYLTLMGIAAHFAEWFFSEERERFLSEDESLPEEEKRKHRYDKEFVIMDLKALAERVHEEMDEVCAAVELLKKNKKIEAAALEEIERYVNAIRKLGGDLLPKET